MKFDYWNHPLIVKAFRVKYRGGKMFFLASGYLMLQLMGASTMYHYQAQIGDAWIHRFFCILITVQFVFSALIAAASVASSMQSEVTTRTLDLQRIASISPTQILIGKVVGEPAASYLLAMTTVPVGVMCHVLGGVDLPTLVILYVTLATTTIMIACCAAQHSLEPAAPGKNNAGGWGCVGPLMGLTWMSIPISQAGGPMADLLLGYVGCITPVITLKDLYSNSPFFHQMPFFGAFIPYAVVTPILQLAVAVLALQCMARRLTWPLNTYASKLQCYATLLVADVILAGYVFDSSHGPDGATESAVTFAIGHTIVGLALTFGFTPRRETYLSWVWRFRGRRSAVTDLLYGERTTSPVALAVFSLIGLTVFGIGVLAPIALFYPEDIGASHWRAVAIAASLSVVLLFACGVFFQVLCITTPKEAIGILLVVALVVISVPAAVGAYYDLPFVSSFSPVSMMIRLIKDPSKPYPPFALLGSYAAATLFFGWGLAGITRNLRRQVDRKLQSIAVSDLRGSAEARS